MIPVGPFATLGVWLVVVVVILRRDTRAPEAEAHQIRWFELVPFAVAIAMIQLLLDLHRAGLGDAVALAVHAVALAILWLRRRPA